VGEARREYSVYRTGCNSETQRAVANIKDSTDVNTNHAVDDEVGDKLGVNDNGTSKKISAEGASSVRCNQ
jgi:hypothetical protein